MLRCMEIICRMLEAHIIAQSYCEESMGTYRFRWNPNRRSLDKHIVVEIVNMSNQRDQAHADIVFGMLYS